MDNPTNDCLPMETDSVGANDLPQNITSNQSLTEEKVLATINQNGAQNIIIEATEKSIESSETVSRKEDSAVTESDNITSNQSLTEEKVLATMNRNGAQNIFIDVTEKSIESSETVSKKDDSVTLMDESSSEVKSTANPSTSLPLVRSDCANSTSPPCNGASSRNELELTRDNSIMLEDQVNEPIGGRSPLYENYCGAMDQSSSEDDELSGSALKSSSSFFGIELDSVIKQPNESPDKLLSNEVNNDLPVNTLPDEEPVVIESKLSGDDSLNIHRGAVVPYSDTEDSDSSSDSSSYESSEESSESEDSSEESVTEETDEKAKSNSSKPKKQKKVPGELDIDDLPPIQDLHISVRNDQVVEIGKVLHAVDTLVVVEGYKDQPPLDIESVLFLDRGARPLGRIFDVMGPVKEPLYCVRFNSRQHIDEQNIQPGMLVYCAPQTEHSNFVFLQHLLSMKGSDASWKKDKETPSSYQDFSDDEEEVKMRKCDNQKKMRNLKSPGEPSPKAPRTNMQSSIFHQSSTPDHQGTGFRPRNPWGGSGIQNYNSRNQHHQHRPTPPTHHVNPYQARGHVRPPSFNVESQFQNQPSFRNQSRPNRYPSNPQFGRESDPRMFGQPAMSSFNSAWPSTERTHPNQGPGYGPRPPMNQWQSQAPPPMNQWQSQTPPPMNQWQPQAPYVQNSHNPPNDQRYQAFQTEIARLVDAYNRGAESPMAVHPPALGTRPSRPPPDWNSYPN